MGEMQASNLLVEKESLVLVVCQICDSDRIIRNQ